MKHLQKTSVLLAMLLMGSCDENMMGETDASTPETCVLYVSPGAESDAGDGASASAPLSSVDAVVSKASALKSSCGNATEVRFSDGSLSEEQYGVASEALKTAGIKVGRYSMNTPTIASMSASTRSDGIAFIDKNALLDNRTPLESFPGLSESLVEDMTSRSGTTADYYSITGTSPYLMLDPTAANYVDWVVQNNAGNLNIRRSTASSAAIDGERIGLRSNLTPSSAVDVSGFENGGSGSGSGVLRLYNGTTIATPLVMDSNEIDSHETIGLFLNNNSKTKVTTVGPAASWSGTSTSAPTGVLEISNASYLGDTSNGSRNYLLIGNGQIDAYNRNKTSSTALAYSKKDLALQSLSGGRVLIGKMTDTTNAKLIVGGTIKASELLIDTVTGADFVFEDEYDLMSLEDVESFVRENKHLPEVASAEEMKKEGVPMAELQIKLLQKIEELTLYAIEQEKRIAALEKGRVTK